MVVYWSSRWQLWSLLITGELLSLIVANSRISLLLNAANPHGSHQTLKPEPCNRSRKILLAEYGEISDSPLGSNYTQDSHCEWLIKATNKSQFITLTFHSMSTECSYDYIYVYDGDSFNSTLLGSFSGRTQPQRLVAKSGSMLILMYSDTNYVLDGFRASYFISNCLNNCHNHGKCIGHECVCHGEWLRPNCEFEACPHKCGEHKGQGKCLKGVCHCSKGYSGRFCDLFENPDTNSWRWLATDVEGMMPRAAHTAVYLPDDDSLYVFGGYDLNRAISSLEIYRFSKSEWEDEWGIALTDLRRQHYNHQPSLDYRLLKAVLQHRNAEEAELWGLRSDVSIFRNILYTLARTSSFSNLYEFERHRRHSYLKEDSAININNVNSTKSELNEIIDNILDNITDQQPAARYGHAATRVPNGFVIFGGKSANGSFFNDLWFYNNKIKSNAKWKQLATKSRLKPLPVARHTITFANNYLYVFGGSLNSGEFSSSIYCIKWLNELENKTMDNSSESNWQWKLIKPHGGKQLDVRLAAHTTVYYRSSNSLIIFGGIMTSLARFSKLSDRIFAFQIDKYHWTEILYPRTALRDTNIPRERAFHSATISGNYMIVFGGYTHRHNKDEICYDNQMYWYHLSCNIWINQVVSANESLYPKKQGVFAHAAALRRNNTLLIVGGYHGNVNADLFAYELPEILRVTNIVNGNSSGSNHIPEISCRSHHTHTACLSYPECGWCSADNSCYGRTIGANCTTNLQTTRCPGICPSLGDCHACLVHGTQWNKALLEQADQEQFSVANKLGLNECSWCVQNAKCHHRDDNYGSCGEDTPSRNPGWWGELGTEIRDLEQCTRYDRRPGLTYIQYHYPINLTMPDMVSIVNATMVDFASPIPSSQYEQQKIEGDMMARLIGFVWPQKQWKEDSTEMQVCTSHSSAIFRAGISRNISELQELAHIAFNQLYCRNIAMPSTEQPFLIDFQARRRIDLAALYGNYAKTKMELQHFFHGNLNAFTFEYLEPYHSGINCQIHTNCLQCLTDSACGWCSIKSECLPKIINETIECKDNDFHWEYLITQPSYCSNCSNFVSCQECIASNFCEWWIDEARCARLGKLSNGIRRQAQCPLECRLRKNCHECINERGRCVWCAARDVCFSFAVYTSEYQFGMCREWLDQTLGPFLHDDHQAALTNGFGRLMPTATLLPPPTSQNRHHHISLSHQKCKSCVQHRNCSSCLGTLSCGWCYDQLNPIEGVCLQGDFNRPFGNCSVDMLISPGIPGITSLTESNLNTSNRVTKWAYAQCPDVDECSLGLHDCHREANCTNTLGSYNCSCRQGFIGDGHLHCIRTCYETCQNGYCSGLPDFVCKCKLGWTGNDCSLNCGCNNHSTCTERIGKCDTCQAWTEGDRCERCRQGSFGNATSDAGCSPCECNGHGNQDMGICNVNNGSCFCKDNTIGLKCDKCANGYYGDPRDGGQCYFQCESRGILRNISSTGIGSYQSHHSAPDVPRECLWILSPIVKKGDTSLFQLEIEWSNLSMDCDDNAVYIYDNLPNLSGNIQQNQLIAVICNPYTVQHIVEARSNHITVYYKHGKGSIHKHYGFNAIYMVKNCAARSCLHPHICDDQQRCICPAGYVGPRCEIEICPKNCHAKHQQGYCDTDYGRCICNAKYAGIDCSSIMKSNQITVTELFNTNLLSENFEHLRKIIPRFGHTICADRRGSLWMFGGYSPSHGPLNDFRQFDTKNGTWMQVTVESTPEDKMPLGRYFHAAEIYLQKQTIYIYGGITVTNFRAARDVQNLLILGDFWQFLIQNQRWIELDMGEQKIRPPPLAGHTLTFTRDTLLLIGGLTTNDSHHLQLWQFHLETYRWEQLFALGMRMPILLYGHSTVYHSEKHIVYVFGGYANEPQNKLYALYLQKMMWTELPTFRDLNRPESFLPRMRYFHSAVTTDDYMVIYGGRTHPYNGSDVLIAYIYNCNQWIRLTEDIHIVGQLENSTYAEDISIDLESNTIYVIGGWDGRALHGQVTRITLPSDLCQLWSGGKYLCRHYMGCSFCTVAGMVNTSSYCFSHGNIDICSNGDGLLAYNRGAICDDAWMAKRNCTSFTTCSSCLASWPTHSETAPVCQWCDECGVKGRCVPAGVDCNFHSSWCSKEISVGFLNLCPQPQCHTLNCETCILNENCQWARNELGIIECITKELVIQNDYVIIGQCPAPCHTYRNCADCLRSDDLNDVLQPKDCKWSTMLSFCLSPEQKPLFCAGGICGLVLETNETENCPEPCEVYKQCSKCLEHAHCGWCARKDSNGEGVCTEGTNTEDRQSDQLLKHSLKCDHLYSGQKNILMNWNYIKCPAENECSNNHHNCDFISERCIDAEEGFQCICGDGYRAHNGSCIPVCSQGCIRGQCVRPKVCECHFGYVGSNCSIQCLCNGHSNCKGQDMLAECLNCHNNTMGAQCEKCRPLFVGDPRDGNKCIPCKEYCNGHTNICLVHDSDPAFFNMTEIELERNLPEGPVSNAVCLRCSNFTSGPRCNTCIMGYFRGTDDHQKKCRPCQCHGHGNICDPITGEKCNCGNNTESDGTCTSAGGKNSAQLCWSVQCSKCRDSYAGNPIDGHQCYKQITVESQMCLDAKPIEECKSKPAALKPGQTVFFVLQPRFMNVDIRVIIDVTQGELDVYMSPQDDSFIVETNITTGHHDIYLDNRYNWGPPELQRIQPLNIALSRSENRTSFAKLITNERRNSNYYTPHLEDCKSHGGHSFYVRDEQARDLTTYVTLNQCNTLLRLFGLKNRLVLSLPQNAHNLSATRFFIALRAGSGPEPSYGSVVFRQDQLHIDLFVFFSVFFSCFFLFLAVCVVIWKLKQAADIRQARRQHVVELLHLAKRPFAHVLLAASSLYDNSIEHEASIATIRTNRNPSNNDNTQLPEVMLLAIEPTFDHYAAIGTVFVSLPGRYKAPLSIALGSALIMYPRSYPLVQRNFMRTHRSSCTGSGTASASGGNGLNANVNLAAIGGAGGGIAGVGAGPLIGINPPPT